MQFPVGFWTRAAAASSYRTPDILGWKCNGTGTTEAASDSDTGPTLTLSNAGLRGTGFTPGGSTSDLEFNASYTAASTATVNYASNNIITIEFRLYLPVANIGSEQRILETDTDWTANFNDWGVFWGVGSSYETNLNLVWTDASGAGNKWHITTGGLTSNTWYHVALVLDNSAAGGVPTAYVNGSSATIVKWQGTFGGTSGVIATKTLHAGGSGSYAKIKDVRIWAGARSGANIALDAVDYP